MASCLLIVPHAEPPFDKLRAGSDAEKERAARKLAAHGPQLAAQNRCLR